MSRFRIGDRVMAATNNQRYCDVYEGMLGVCDENNDPCPFIRFDDVPGRVSVWEEDLLRITGKETELEKLLLWTNYGK
jgi:ATP-dependent exoDNAse (exonuclease V) alpha subunit